MYRNKRKRVVLLVASLECQKVIFFYKYGSKTLTESHATRVFDSADSGPLWYSDCYLQANKLYTDASVCVGSSRGESRHEIIVQCYFLLKTLSVAELSWGKCKNRKTEKEPRIFITSFIRWCSFPFYCSVCLLLGVLLLPSISPPPESC